MSLDDLIIRVADIGFSITSHYPVASIAFPETYQGFTSAGKVQVDIRARYGELPRLAFRDRDLLFDSGMVWTLYRREDKHIFSLQSPVFGSLPYRIAVFAPDFSEGDIYTRLESFRNHPMAFEGASLLPDPLAFPLSEVSMICLLAQGRGLMVHASGITDREQGYLFAGNSTHGKSTMARLWKDEGLILNDDRIVIREKEGRFWMYGTPWHGEFDVVSSTGVPLSKIFFLRHGAGNSAVPQRGAQASTMLLTRSFSPLWDKEGMQYTLGLCHRVTKEIACYELGFVPDHSAVDFIRSL
jgi:hypothetical protein